MSRTWQSNKNTPQKFRYIMDRSHNRACSPSLPLFVLNDFPVCPINKDRTEQGAADYPRCIKENEGVMHQKSNCREKNCKKVNVLLLGSMSVGLVHLIGDKCLME